VTFQHGLPEGVSGGSDLPLEKKSTYRHPRSGEARKHRKPLSIDRLPATVKDAIIGARAAGETWKETARIASACAGMTLAPSTLQRWFDLRVQQPGEAVVLLRTIVRLLENILAEVRR